MISQYLKVTGKKSKKSETMSIEPTKSNDDSNYVWNNTEWDFIPDPVLLKILTQLPVRDILNVSECCRRWNDICKDDYLWKKVFQRDFKVDKLIAIKPGNFQCFNEIYIDFNEQAI